MIEEGRKGGDGDDRGRLGGESGGRREGGLVEKGGRVMCRPGGRMPREGVWKGKEWNGRVRPGGGGSGGEKRMNKQPSSARPPPPQSP